MFTNLFVYVSIKYFVLLQKILFVDSYKNLILFFIFMINLFLFYIVNGVTVLCFIFVYKLQIIFYSTSITVYNFNGFFILKFSTFDKLRFCYYGTFCYFEIFDFFFFFWKFKFWYFFMEARLFIKSNFKVQYLMFVFFVIKF